VLEDTDLLYTGRASSRRFLGRHGKEMESWQQGGHTTIGSRPAVLALLVNEFVYLEADRPSTRR
jgi:PhoH-like ATPase